MEVWHRVALNTSKKKFSEAIHALGVTYHLLDLPGRPNGFMYFDIKESEPVWERISNLIATEGASDIFDTFFDEDEIRQAEYCRLVSTFEHGYPQPMSNWPLKQASYESVCTKCGIYTQTSELRIRNEPRLGRNSFMSLTWVGEILCTPNVITEFCDIGATGFDTWGVRIHKSNLDSERLRQLHVPNVLTSGSIVGPLIGESVCLGCNTTKQYAHTRGRMQIKKDAFSQGLDFVKTDEWFGSGLVAFREILVSNRIAKLILERGWRGARLKVVELV